MWGGEGGGGEGGQKGKVFQGKGGGGREGGKEGSWREGGRGKRRKRAIRQEGNTFLSRDPAIFRGPFPLTEGGVQQKNTRPSRLQIPSRRRSRSRHRCLARNEGRRRVWKRTQGRGNAKIFTSPPDVPAAAAVSLYPQSINPTAKFRNRGMRARSAASPMPTPRPAKRGAMCQGPPAIAPGGHSRAGPVPPSCPSAAPLLLFHKGAGRGVASACLRGERARDTGVRLSPGGARKSAEHIKTCVDRSSAMNSLCCFVISGYVYIIIPESTTRLSVMGVALPSMGGGRGERKCGAGGLFGRESN